MKKEDFIKNILNSTSGIVKTMPNDDLLNKIQAKIEEEKPATDYAKWLVAASILLLLSLNIGVLSTSNKNATKSNEISQLVAATDNQLY